VEKELGKVVKGGGVSEERYLIWSFEHGAWWRPARMGYTRRLSEAGRYSAQEARDIVFKANRYTEHAMEMMVAEEDGPKFAEAL
jgi:hypothetical protein